MTDEAIEMIETPDTCEATNEYDNRIEDDIEIDPEDDEQEDMESGHKRDDIEEQFARYERNYRVRRIREMTLAPIKNEKGKPSNRVAA